jgi:excinuclease ABC subunit B
MAEELTKFLTEAGVKCNYIHSDVETLERIKIMDALRKGIYDVLIGVNLLREGLDLPEVSLVAVLDADKEGFLRSHRSLTQTAGRAARNINGFVIFYAGHITKSMQLTLDETNRRREKQLAYNAKYGIKPVPIVKNAVSLLGELPSEEIVPIDMDQLTTKPAIIDAIAQARGQLKSAIENVDFVQAANLRNVVVRLHELLEKLP